MVGLTDATATPASPPWRISFCPGGANVGVFDAENRMLMLVTGGPEGPPGLQHREMIAALGSAAPDLLAAAEAALPLLESAFDARPPIDDGGWTETTILALRAAVDKARRVRSMTLERA